MGGQHQLEFVKANRELLRGPMLEVGSHNYGNTQTFRPLLAGADFAGIDAIEGPGVDLALGLARPFDDRWSPVREGSERNRRDTHLTRARGPAPFAPAAGV